MQENINVPATRTANGRNKSNTAVTTAKKSVAVKKNNKNVSAKRASNMHAVRAPKIVNVKKKDKAPFPWSVVLVSVLMTGLFLFMMMNYAEVDKYRSENTELTNKIASLEKTQDALEVELSNKYDQKDIREYATEELDMVHVNEMPNSSIIYVTIEQEDKTEMHTYDDGEEGGFGFLLTGFGEVIRDFFE